MKNKRSLFSNYIFNFLTQILVLIIPIITTPYISRVLMESTIGRISYSNSIVTYFLLLSSLGFNLYGQRMIAKFQDDNYEKSKLFWEIVFCKIILTVCSIILLYSILFSVGFGDKYNIFILASSIQLFGTMADINFFFQGDEDFKTVSLITIVSKILSLIGIFVFVKSPEDGYIYILLMFGSVIFGNLISWLFLRNKIHRIDFKKIRLLRHFKPSFMIFLPTLAVTVYSVFDNTMIGLLSPNPDFDNGCYDRAYKINSISLILVTVLSPIMVPRNAHDYSSGDIKSLKKHLDFSFSYVWMVGCPLIIGFAVLSANLCSWYLGDGFETVPILMQIMSTRFLISGFGDVFGQQLFIAIGKEKYPTIATFVGAGINVLLNLILIPIYGALGAAIATSVCELVVTTIMVLIARKEKYISILELFKKSVKYIIASILMFVPIYFLNNALTHGFLSFLLITLVGISSYFLLLLLLKDTFFINCAKMVILKIKNLFYKNKKENNHG